MTCCGGTNTSGIERYSLILSNTSWHSSSYSNFTTFFNFLKISSHATINFNIMWLLYCRPPKNPCISFSVLGSGIFYIVLTFDRPASMSLRLNVYLNNWCIVDALRIVVFPSKSCAVAFPVLSSSLKVRLQFPYVWLHIQTTSQRWPQMHTSTGSSLYLFFESSKELPKSRNMSIPFLELYNHTVHIYLCLLMY